MYKEKIKEVIFKLLTQGYYIDSIGTSDKYYSKQKYPDGYLKNSEEFIHYYYAHGGYCWYIRFSKETTKRSNAFDYLLGILLEIYEETKQYTAFEHMLHKISKIMEEESHDKE